ncbi:hypothetical protein EM595_1225 [Duffyella gerundensis]|uniref:Uncharacterized protein n=1 Tax=Duffyella gerundensis TaxID=1619313 RepID=A0A0U5L459_9GAMM|nr:hypothetical protein EM595_1225 [Duffyella gerundensis]
MPASGRSPLAAWQHSPSAVSRLLQAPVVFNQKISLKLR